MGTPGTKEHKPASGPIDGVMAWQGDIRDNERRSGARRLFIIRDANRRFFWGVSERAGIAELRRCPNGARVWLACTGKRPTGTIIEGREVFRLMFDLVAEKLLDRPVPVLPVPESARSFGGAAMEEPPPPGDDDVPF